MALLIDKQRTNKLRERLEEFSKFGMTLYYLLEEGRVSESELDDMFFSSDDDKSSMIYGRIMRKIKSNDLVEAFNRYKYDYPNSSNNEINNYQNNLNLIYISKLLDKLNCEEICIDKAVINTYNYLLEEVVVES